MKLQLSLFAEDLAVPDDEEVCHPYAVVSHVLEGGETKTMGQTEVLRNTSNPDWTKVFDVPPYSLGQDVTLLVTLLQQTSNVQLGSTLVDVGQILATKGGMMGYELQQGGVLYSHVQRTSGMGTVNVEWHGHDLKRKGDDDEESSLNAFLEVQTKRQTTTGESVWDVVYRSRPVEETEQEDDSSSCRCVWDPFSMELSALLPSDTKKKSKKAPKFRVAVKHWDDEEDSPSTIGYVRCTIPQLLDIANQNNREGLTLSRKGKSNAGKLVVLAASQTTPSPSEEPESTARAGSDVYVPNSGPPPAVPAADEDPEIVIDAGAVGEEDSSDDDEDIVLEATEDITFAPTSNTTRTPTFPDYIAGGCSLRVLVAIDYTASNGDPRKEDSLHHFSKDGETPNSYERAILQLCSILSEYDSDQKYPVWGFGAKQNGVLNHCFSCCEGSDEAEGVEGIVKAYKHAFQTGIGMSSPTDVTEVIQAAGKDAQKCLTEAKAQDPSTQSYAILIVFTNGTIHSVDKTIAALDDVRDDPISVLVVGVGPSDFADMSFLKNRERVSFVDMKASEADLTEASLKAIPDHLVSYFVSKGIQPSAPVPPDDIVIAPFNADEAVQANITTDENGNVHVETSPTHLEMIKEKGRDVLLLQGKRLLERQKRNFGLNGGLQKKFDRMVDQKINKLFGLKPQPVRKPARRPARKHTTASHKY